MHRTKDQRLAKDAEQEIQEYLESGKTAAKTPDNTERQAQEQTQQRSEKTIPPQSASD